MLLILPETPPDVAGRPQIEPQVVQPVEDRNVSFGGLCEFMAIVAADAES
jgi:hypothetical protein